MIIFILFIILCSCFSCFYKRKEHFNSNIITLNFIKKLCSPEFDGRKVGTPGMEKTRNYIIDKIKKIGLETVSWAPDYKNDFVLWKKHYMNICSYIPAKTETKNTIILMAHYDHLGRKNENIYFPGANDNASGVYVILSVMEKLKKNLYDCSRNKNFLCILTDGEEDGLKGSNYIISKNYIKKSDVELLINFDLVSGCEGNQIGIVAETPTLRKKLIKSAEKTNIEIDWKAPVSRSDFYPFNQQGFNCMEIGHCLNEKYHTPADTFDSINKPILQKLINFVYEIII